MAGRFKNIEMFWMRKIIDMHRPVNLINIGRPTIVNKDLRITIGDLYDTIKFLQEEER